MQKSKLEGDNIRNVNSLGEKINDSITKTQQQEFIKNLNKIPGNDKCADCSQTNPTWASLNLGILICIKCSGIHRNLGTHISKIRSLELDDWPKSSQKILLQIGNKISNNIWLHGYHGDKIENMNNSELELHITEKYVNKSFLRWWLFFEKRIFTRNRVRKKSRRNWGCNIRNQAVQKRSK